MNYGQGKLLSNIMEVIHRGFREEGIFMSVLRLGTTEVTPAAAGERHLQQMALSRGIFRRHERCDWGKVDERRQRYDDMAVQ
jgi:hypothetical protein